MEPIRLFGAGGAPDTEIQLPEDGGLVVFRGSNGAGKSQALAAIDGLTTGRKTIAVKHGRNTGEVSGFGVAIKLGARTQRKGELDVVGLSSRMDIGAIVDPGLKERDPANRAVVKALVRMLGIEPRVERFHELVDSRADGETEEAYRDRCRATFNELMEAGLDELDDLVDLARRVKSGFDAAARRVKGEAERVQGEADALLSTGSDLPLDAEHDTEALQDALEAAIRAESALEEKAKKHKALCEEARAARALIADGGGPDPATIQAARDEIAATEEDITHRREGVQQRADYVADLERQLETARRDHKVAEEKLADRERDRDAAARRLAELEQSTKGWEAAQAAIERLESAESAPSADDLEAAEGIVQAARDALELGALVRNALDKREHGRTRRRDAARLRGREDELRDAGRATDAVLSQLINEHGVDGITVVDGEVLAVPPGEKAPRPFLDLSDGQRTRVACDAMIPVALKGVPEGELGVIVLGQRVYQDLDYDNRRALAEYVRGRRVLLFTALPTEGEMEAVIVEPDSDEGVRQ